MGYLTQILLGTPSIANETIDKLLDGLHNHDIAIKEVDESMVRCSMEIREKGDCSQKQYILLAWLVCSDTAKKILTRGEPPEVCERFYQVVISGLCFFMHGRGANGKKYPEGTSSKLRKLGVFVSMMRGVYAIL